MKRIGLGIALLIAVSMACCVYESSMPTNEDMNMTNYISKDSWNKILEVDTNESAYAHDKLSGDNVCRGIDTP